MLKAVEKDSISLHYASEADKEMKHILRMGLSSIIPENGYRIISINEKGPMANKELNIWFDFIVAINDEEISTGFDLFFKQLAKNEDNQTKITLFNSISRKEKVIEITPNSNWGKETDDILGARVRLDTIESDLCLLRVTGVEALSPAHESGLESKVYWILGTFERTWTTFKEFEDVATEMARKNASFDCLVYNEQRSKVRLVHINPRPWEGGGVLGCKLSTGAIRPPDFKQTQLVD